jgi:Xaa-Pro aminopeptidase
MPNPLLLVGDSESDQNLYYKTHFLAGDPFVYLEAPERRLLVVSPMEQGRAQKESTVADVRTFDDFGYTELVRAGNDRTEAFVQILARIIDNGTGAVQVDGKFPLMYADSLRAGGITLEIERESLTRARRVKTADEIGAIERAQRATERATAHAIEIVAQSEEVGGFLHFNGIPLTSERLRTEIELALTREGLDPGTPIVAAGPGAADPHWVGAGPIRAGEAIVFDVFPRDKTSRYFADMTRTVVKGNPGDLLRKMYDATLRAQEAALAEIRAGANGRDAHNAVLESFRQSGFGGESGPRQTHGTGHGLGLDIHEAPNLGNVDGELLEGDVVTVEPGLYDPEVGGVRIEDLVVVAAGGYRNLTSFPKQFEV